MTRAHPDLVRAMDGPGQRLVEVASGRRVTVLGNRIDDPVRFRADGSDKVETMSLWSFTMNGLFVGAGPA